MKKVLLVLLFLVSFMTQAVAEIKIGIVDVNKILKDAPQTISANKTLEKEFKSRTDKLKASITALQDKEKKYQKDSLTMAQADREKTEKKLQEERIGLQRSERELREDMDLRRREEIGDLQDKINQTIDKMAAEEGFDLILYNGIAFASAKVDITSKVIDKLGGSVTEEKPKAKDAKK
jgi:outer membrane protein